MRTLSDASLFDTFFSDAKLMLFNYHDSISTDQNLAGYYTKEFLIVSFCMNVLKLGQRLIQ